MSALQLGVVVITPPDITDREEGTIQRLFGSGLQRLHVRKPGLTPTQLHAHCVSTVPLALRDRVMLHGPAQLAQDLGMKVAPCPVWVLGCSPRKHKLKPDS